MKRPLVTLLASAVALPALAQDASQDWNLVRDRRGADQLWPRAHRSPGRDHGGDPRQRPARRHGLVTTCLTTPDGRLDDCVVEMEHPHDSGFGEATLRSTRRARLRNTAQPGEPVPLQLVSFRTSFRQPL